ncbi:hypothetical protein GCM10020358_04150 [Amorphoplanes nipponensis]|uniref:Uncharacterized protein n=1 Tax=Actinoplanes nipponensis TaxID=135950 RepID=A0A919JNW1_9ACTN|nr:hypothetical protein [Actinoplanes nipponensis]GIE52692.1 hypothetical protein Ani05nite_62260 [Actinoplanes nipponensis]
MADDLEDLFAGLRADTMPRIRPPGVDRVRRTVRRRRTATAAFAGVLLLALSGTVALLGFPSRPRVPAADSLPQTELDRLTGVADRAVTAGNPGPAVFSRRGPVTGFVSATEQIYLGEIDLQIACAGAGSVTLLVRGTPGSESGSTERVEVARLTAQCTAEPLPAEATFVLGRFVDITVELVDVDSARGRAGFAYRATSDTGRPAARTETNDPGGVVPQDLPPGSGWGGGGEVSGRRLDSGWTPLNGDFRLAVACAGTGTLRVTLRQARSAADPEGTVAATRTYAVACQYPPKRQDLVVGKIRNRPVNLTLTYGSASPAPGEAAFQFLPR